MITKLKVAIRKHPVWCQMDLAKQLKISASQMGKYVAGTATIPPEHKTILAILLGYKVTNELFPEGE